MNQVRLIVNLVRLARREVHEEVDVVLARPGEEALVSVDVEVQLDVVDRAAAMLAQTSTHAVVPQCHHAQVVALQPAHWKIQWNDLAVSCCPEHLKHVVFTSHDVQQSFELRPLGLRADDNRTRVRALG